MGNMKNKKKMIETELLSTEFGKRKEFFYRAARINITNPVNMN